MELLASSFNVATVDGLMCCSTINSGDEGEVFDCDFDRIFRMQQRNQGKPLYLWDVTPESMAALAIRTANLCLGCTAGAGSSCTGALAGHEAKPECHVC